MLAVVASVRGPAVGAGRDDVDTTDRIVPPVVEVVAAEQLRVTDLVVLDGTGRRITSHRLQGVPPQVSARSSLGAGCLVHPARQDLCGFGTDFDGVRSSVVGDIAGDERGWYGVEHVVFHGPGRSIGQEVARPAG